MYCLFPPLLYRRTATDVESQLLQSVASDRFQCQVHPSPHRYTLEEVKIKDVVLRLVAVHQMEMREAHLVLTGQRIWPAAKVLGLYLVENPDIVQSAGSVLELGAGPGLPGLVAAKLAPQPERVVLTDNKDLVLDLLEKNIVKNFNDDPMADKPRCSHLEWGKGVADFRDQHGGFDVILASDVIYHRPDIPLLLQTARDLLNDKPTSVLLLSYNDRAKIFQQTVKETAAECGLEWTDIPFRELLPDFSQIVHPDEVRHLHLMVFMKGAS
ncbi:protein N-lysine methyltransferase METTL21A-like isoform X1 [Branchiostoma lanceolatum]|uniref:protein N-lysine methyltransferase METTL21A-like isoform X1 n=1 Tax=Branchiostoma lanceolatum TaxID=7740 RepID=UPI0034569877